MRAVFVAIALVISACGHGRDTGEFEPYVARFEQESIRQGTPVKIKDIAVERAVLAPNNLGVCIGEIGFGYPVIRINGAMWDKMDDLTREVLIFHELGHCILKRCHVYAYGPDRRPVSIMVPIPYGGDYYSIAREMLVAELFHPGPYQCVENRSRVFDAW